MSSGNPEAGEPERNFVFFFTVTLLTAAAAFGLQYALTLLLLPLMQSGMNGVGSHQLYSVAQSLIQFAFNPAFCFLIFYRIGTMTSVRTTADHFRVLTGAFTGGRGVRRRVCRPLGLPTDVLWCLLHRALH